MTGTDDSFDAHDRGGDVAAYALGALDPSETEAFRVHLETCIVCRDELAAFQRVVDVIPVSAPQHRAPKRLRRRVLEGVKQASERDFGGRRRRQTARLPLLARVSIPRPALALSVAAAAIAIAFGAVELGTQGTTTTRVFAAHVTGSGSAEVTVTAGRAELIVHRLSPPPAGQVYEVWLARRDRPPVRSSLFTVRATGEGRVGVSGSLRGVDRVMVTPEPAGGSRVPTHAPVITAQLS